MLKARQDIADINTVPMVSSHTSPGDAENNSNNYALVFPPLPISKTLGMTNGQTAPFKKRSHVRISIVNEVIYHAILIVTNKY